MWVKAKTALYFMKVTSTGAALLVLFSSGLRGEDLKFFEKKINYWGEKTPEKAPLKKEGQEEKNTLFFDWSKYLDPKRDEFFREGDYTPPAPFMEVARNPNPHNIKMWFSYIEKKNRLAAELQEKLTAYSMGDEVSFKSNEVREKKLTEGNSLVSKSLVSAKPLDRNRFKFRLYFDASCPHCKKMFGSLSALKESGFEVEAKKIGGGSLAGFPEEIKITSAAEDEVKRLGIKGVPFLVIIDDKRKTVSKLQGYRDEKDILKIISK